MQKKKEVQKLTEQLAELTKDFDKVFDSAYLLCRADNNDSKYQTLINGCNNLARKLGIESSDDLGF